MAGADLLDAAADHLGMDPADVREALRNGESLADLAKDKGKSVDGLESALRDETRKDADQAVAHGVLTKEEADRVVEKLSDAVDDLVGSSGGPGFEFGLRDPGFGPGRLRPLERGLFPGAFPGADLMQSAAEYLGIDEADIRETLRDGKSLADLATERGKSADGLKKALRDDIRKDADQAVEDGVMPKEHADRLVEKLGSVVDKVVEGSLRGGFDSHFRGGGGKFEFHFRGGPKGRMPLPQGRERPRSRRRSSRHS